MSSFGKADYGVPPERFVEVWETSESAQEVADRLKMPKPIVLARASTYRHAGVQLKKMRRTTGRGLNVAKLNNQIAELRRRREARDSEHKTPVTNADLEKAARETIKRILGEMEKGSAGPSAEPT